MKENQELREKIEELEFIREQQPYKIKNLLNPPNLSAELKSESLRIRGKRLKEKNWRDKVKNP